MKTPVAECGFGGPGALDQVRIGRGRQVAGAVDAALGVRVGTGGRAGSRALRGSCASDGSGALSANGWGRTSTVMVTPSGPSDGLIDYNPLRIASGAHRDCGSMASRPAGPRSVRRRLRDCARECHSARQVRRHAHGRREAAEAIESRLAPAGTRRRVWSAAHVGRRSRLRRRARSTPGR